VGKLNSVDCYRFRGDLLDLRGDWSSAQAWYAKAVKLGPSIPSGYYSWGVALAKRGNLDAAAAKLMDANQKGPHWADPPKAWGDVLVKQGRTKDALVKYDEALKCAPNWKQLKEAREALAKQKSYLVCPGADVRDRQLRAQTWTLGTFTSHGAYSSLK
jgi:tetratricopeptide (TPR) repeat protein